MNKDRIDGQPDLQQLLAWLMEQRQKDHEAVDLLAGQVGRIVRGESELTQAVRRLDDEIVRLRQQLGQLSPFSDAVRQLRESIDLVATRVEDQAASRERELQAANAEVARDRRGLGELAQRVAELQRTIEGLNTRQAAIAEETRHERGELSSLVARLEAVERQCTQLVGRLRQSDEAHRRTENMLSVLQERGESLEKAINEVDNWQKLADLRWNRQLGDWQQQLDRWRAELDERTRSIPGIAQQLGVLGDADAALRELIVQREKQIELIAVGVQRVDGALASVREQTQHVADAGEAQRRRIDELVSAQWKVSEDTQRGMATAAELRDHLERQRVRLDELRAWTEELERKRQRTQDMADLLAVRLREQGLLAEEHDNQLRDRLVALQAEAQARFILLERRELAFRERQVGVLQAEVRELTEVLARWQGSSQERPSHQSSVVSSQ
ncbi:MAG: hypothetical protein HYY04_16305 [Chloroflexi bacterium]|nr:hypothetical protein [Chloroflexota bacterium]